MLKLALIGYGSMGKEIHKFAQSKGYEITNIFEMDNPISLKGNFDFDVAIDFSYPEAVINNVNTIADLGKNIVIGTTGWYDKIQIVKNIAEQMSIGVIYASNFALGSNLFIRIVDLASKIINKFDSFDIFINEIHHKNKKDSPSGTALFLADLILKNIERKKTILNEPINKRISPEQLHIASLRGGSIIGIHNIFIDSEAETIELTHRAKNRLAFAEGALLAANWIIGKKGFYNFSELIDDIIK